MAGMSKLPRSLGRRLRFAQLELVHEVAESGSLGEAAARLHISRAAVSKSIRELERSLGQVLFERSAKGMVATAAGLRVARHARLMVNELRHLADDVATTGGEAESRLRIGLPPFVAEHVAPTILQRLAQGAPITVQLHDGWLHALIEKLLCGEVDAVLALYAPRAVDALDLSMLDIRPFLDVSIVPVAAPSLGVPKRRLRWSELLRFPWILPPASTHLRRSVDEMFTARGSRTPDMAIESGSFAANVKLSATGMGLAVVPLQAAQTEIAAGRLVVVDARPVLPATHVALMHRKVTAIYMDAIRRLNHAVDGVREAG